MLLRKAQKCGDSEIGLSRIGRGNRLLTLFAVRESAR